MRVLVYTLVASGFLSVGCQHKSPAGSGFEMRLIANESSSNTENLLFTNKFATEGEIISESLPVQKAVVIDQTAVSSAKVEKYPGITNLYVEITFTDEGSRRLTEMTRQNIGKRLAIIIDGIVISAPKIEAEISEGKALISARFSKAEANAIADKINHSVKK